MMQCCSLAPCCALLVDMGALDCDHFCNVAAA